MSALDIDNLTLELARLEREAYRRIAAKLAALQLGEAFVNLEETYELDYRQAA